jgi:hypothetical protein
MNDRTVSRAARSGIRTVPVDHKPRPKSLRGNITLLPDEIGTALEMAREIRTKQDIAAYAARKRTSC